MMNCDFRGQFFLSYDATLGPQEWPSQALGQLTLRAHPDLPVHPFRSTCGRYAGWLLGLVLGGNKGDITQGGRAVTLRDHATEAERLQDFESWLYGHGGRFLAVLACADQPRVYLDPTGSLAAVFDAERECCASTPSLFSWRDSEPLLQPILAHMGEAFFWLPFGITSRLGVRRLLPNHFLDLNNWRSERHWLPDSGTKVLDDEHAALLVGDVVARSLEEMCAEHPAYLPLTAGRDSRAILACAKRVRHRLTCFTIARTDLPSGQIDAATAKRITHRFNIPHHVIQPIMATDAEYALFEARVGGVVGVPRNGFHSERVLPADRINMLGAAGEVARAYYSGSYDDLDSACTPELLLERAKFPPIAPLRAAAEQWRQNSGQFRRLSTLDLFYLENRVGCWASPMCYGHHFDTWFPMSHREVFTAFFRISEPSRISGVLLDKIVRDRWPALARYPYNGVTVWRRLRRRLWGVGRLLIGKRGARLARRVFGHRPNSSRR